MTEAELESAVRDLLALYRLYGYHTQDSRRSQPGFPDWVIVSVNGVLWRELKSETGELSTHQRQWRNLLIAAGQDWAVWKPRDLRSGRIEQELQALRP